VDLSLCCEAEVYKTAGLERKVTALTITGCDAFYSLLKQQRSRHWLKSIYGRFCRRNNTVKIVIPWWPDIKF
jgi:hypothetical protein